MKFVLDSLWRPKNDSSRGPAPALLKDDDQIRFLHASLGQARGTPGTYIAVKPLRDVAADLRLAAKLMEDSSDWDDEDLHPEAEYPDPLEPLEIEYFSEAWRRWFGDFYKYSLQIALLTDSDSQLMRQLSWAPFRIFGVSWPENTRAVTADEGSEWAEQAWSHLVDSLALALPALPASHMSRESFRDELISGFDRLRRERPALFPLVAPARMTMLVVPPSENRQNDLDNVARHVMPILRKRLLSGGPDASGLAFVSRILNDFQVIRLVRRETDPPEGILRLLVGSGSQLNSDWERVANFLEGRHALQARQIP
ncbi:hypothetical protein [Actinomycetospora sp. CA-053990]|uniref:hypothetical protein n=1 Tax=Actinomycetospora sp. CA-053990 TaxID=3239891 RepID=UPI003D8ABE4A